MKLVKIWAFGMIVLGFSATALSAPRLGNVLGREGSELGNSFVPFDSKIGDYSLEYSKKWRLTDLSQTTSFTDGEASGSGATSFLSVHSDRTGGPASIAELRERLAQRHPGMIWQPMAFAGFSALMAEKGGVVHLEVLRAPGDLLSLRYRSADKEKSDAVIAHMLSSFRAE
jgi:hypothetical protein